ncbi:DUF742 domain-containing protein [Micromonospora craniellae]|uniref:DUF742 domain-containing protein n=1 Tax=Micromonospora craniellae TaxID=2294034 RepID=A0A372FWS8_9ACTN|nr:DUF742 domain-containing protein [Micromonospora craniellae]QOC90051.1 DUF742 domain-containing protein [Micromonospora craniellae]RFS45252.1 DUF742 domain-containing protein [Micromonospora craniellae]
MNPDAAGAEGEPVFRIRPYLREPSPVGDAGPVDAPAAVGSEPVAAGPTGLRPFVLTAGRVAGADPSIGLETQVTARPGIEPWNTVAARLTPELQAIVALCGEPISVAEISAKTRLHFGVTRVLVGDLRAAGHLDVHVSDADDALDPDVILRVIDGLRAIS